MNAYPDADKWGILNWARDSDRALWKVAPSARIHMLRAAAFRRWSSHYQSQCSAQAFVDYADWLHENLGTVTAGKDGWT